MTVYLKGIRYRLLEQLKKLKLEHVDLIEHEKWIDECKIRIRQIAIIPDLLSHEKRAENNRSPVSLIERDACVSNEPVNVDQTNDNALGAELRAVVEGLDELVDILHTWHLS